PVYSADGRRVAFLSNRGNTSSLFVGTPGGEAHRLPLPTTSVFARAHWSADGRALYAVEQKIEAMDAPLRGVRIDAETGAVDRLDVLGEWISDVRLSADGRTLYFAVQDGQLMQ